jgi:hypothetical protein
VPFYSLFDVLDVLFISFFYYAPTGTTCDKW